MAITKFQRNEMLKSIFAKYNDIELFTVMPAEDEYGNETAGTKLEGAGYTPYSIREGDFLVEDGVVTSNTNIMLYLCDTDDTSYSVDVEGFGVYTNGTGKLLYYGKFNNPMTIKYNSVPTIKKYDEFKNGGEGIKITLTSSDLNAVAE